jgi:hypothetical protein
MRTYMHKIAVVECRFHRSDYMFLVRLPRGTVNWVKARRTRKTGKWQILWPRTPIRVQGKTVLKQTFNPAQRITEYVIAALRGTWMSSLISRRLLQSLSLPNLS